MLKKFRTTIIIVTMIVISGLAYKTYTAKANAPAVNNAQSAQTPSNHATKDADQSNKELTVDGNPYERIIGNKDSKIQVIEYASLSCPHCANFHKHVFPEIKKAFIDTNKIGFTFRDFPFDQRAYKAAILTRCIDKKQYFPFLKTILTTQDDWLMSLRWEEKLRNVAFSAGMTKTAYQTCIDNKDIAQYVLNSRIEGAQRYHVEATPSFVINGKLHRGEMDFETFSKIINEIKP